ncbi:MAG: sulfatase-like hydrolase/transferase [Myxococcota bacterium]
MRALHLFALCGFAIAQPLLDLLARNAQLFVARRSEPLDIIAAISVLVFAPPLALWSFGLIATRISQRLGRSVHVAMCGLLFAMTTLPFANNWLGSANASLAVAAASGIAWGTAYARFEIARRLVTVLAAAPLVFVGVFVMQSPIQTLLFGGSAETTRSAAPGSPAPITLVVFDELPLLSLLDETGAIDTVAYPNFGRLAATSTWFRNATSIESRTLQAIPALLSGRYPSADRRLPIASQHPNTLFSLLAYDYALRVYEPLTGLHDWGSESNAPFAERFGGLSRDVALIYAHTLVPLEWSRGLPAVGEAWRDFAASRTGGPKRGLHGRPTIFRHFVRSIQTSAVPSLNFIHTVLPHGPWQYLPSGNSFHPFFNAGRFLGYWSNNEHFIAEAQWRHLQQVELVDRLLGELLDHLRAIGEFERSIVVVVADHGASFWSGDHYRNFESGQHPADILSVPLFIKRPYQTVGVVDRSNVETIDILPSILDIIDSPVPDEIDGCSLFEPTCPARTEKVAFSDNGGATLVQHHFPADLGLDRAGLQQKLARFGSGTLRSAHRASPYFEWIGRVVSDWNIDARPAGTVKLESARRTWQLGTNESLVAARVIGRLQLSIEPSGPVHVAIAAGGVIRAVVPAPAEGDAYRIVTVLPEAALAEDARIDLFLVTGPRSLARLTSR